VPAGPAGLLNQLSRRTARLKLAVVLRHGYLLTRKALSRLGFELIFSTYDSPVPAVGAIEPGFFERADPLRGIDFDAGRQIEFVERELAGYCREFDPPLRPEQAGSGRFYLHNSTYESVDAELLYAMVRRFEPKRMIELGSGFSTLIARQALQRNEGADPDRVLTTFDPYRSDLLPANVTVVPETAQSVALETFRDLGVGDLLFVDTSHTVKLGGDVNRIVLDILPTLGPGVIVHFHDIFLPYPYSRAHLVDAHFWSEQYLLQAFLSGNRDWEVLVGAFAVARAHPDRLAAAVPSFGPGVNPGAFWIRRRL
jgi:predicted O-methyltransferase YrrM